MDEKHFQQFIAATTPSTFAVNWRLYILQEGQAAEFHLTNGIGEELHGIWTEVDGELAFEITRHPAGWNTKEAQKWIDEMTKERDSPCIWIEEPTIG